MPKKKTHGEYLVELLSKEINITPIEEYKTAIINIMHKCNVCGNEWSSRPANILTGYGCPKCAKKRIGDSLRETHDGYIEKLKQLNCDIIVIERYSGRKTKILHKCNVCNNEWKTTPNTILNGCGCPICSEKIRAFNRTKTQRYYIKEVSEINSMIEVVGEYISAKKQTLHKCKKCGNEWEALSSNILKGHGCPSCSAKEIGDKLRKSHEQYTNDLYNINPNIEVIEEYKGADTPILHKCKICHNNWIVRPENLLQKRSCPNCTVKSKGEDAIQNYLKENNIVHFEQQKFSGLKGVYGGLLSYDFYLPDYNLLIEYQGEQHFRSIEYFGGEKAFIKQQEHDKRKRNYAKLHKINLLEIRYDEDVNPALDKYFNNINNSNNLNSESLETVMPTIAI